MNVCTLTDLDVDACGCAQHHRAETTVISLAALERLAGHQLPAYRAIIRPPWRVPTPEATVCEHQRDGLCKTCDELLDGLLADLPHLVEELGFAMRKDCRFAPHGFRRSDVGKPDEAPIPWNPAAADVLGTLNRIVADRTQDRRELLHRLSTVAERAHRVIDRPKDVVFVGSCPDCGKDLWIEREQPVICEACNYHAPWLAHQQATIDARSDQLMTMDEVVNALNSVGEPITRKRVEYLEKRYGLPREKHTVPHWQGQSIRVSEVWMYRLRDIRELQSRLANTMPRSTL